MDVSNACRCCPADTRSIPSTTESLRKEYHHQQAGANYSLATITSRDDVTSVQTPQHVANSELGVETEVQSSTAESSLAELHTVTSLASAAVAAAHETHEQSSNKATEQTTHAHADAMHGDAHDGPASDSHVKSSSAVKHEQSLSASVETQPANLSKSSVIEVTSSSHVKYTASVGGDTTSEATSPVSTNAEDGDVQIVSMNV